MICFLNFLSILGFVGILSKKYPKFISLYPLLVSCGIIILLYFFSFIGLLFWASKIIFITGLVLLIYCVVFIIVKNRFSPLGILRFLHSVPSPIWFFIIIGTLWLFFTQAAALHNCDEFYWATYAKYLFYNNGFNGIYGSIITYGFYFPPASPLNQYFYLQNGNFAESTLYFAQGILIFSAISYVFVLRRENFLRNAILLFVLAACFTYFLFSQFGFLSLLIDHDIGIIFGIGFLISAWSLKTVKQKLLILPIIFLLSIFKENGIIFAYIIVVYNLIDLWRTYGKEMFVKFVNIMMVLIIITTPIAALKSWQIYMGQYNRKTNFRIQYITNVDQTNSDAMSQQSIAPRNKKQIAKNFFSAVLELPINSAFQKNSLKVNAFIGDNVLLRKILDLTDIGRFSLAVWLLIAMMFLLVFYLCLRNNDRINFLALSLVALLGFVVYLLFILVAYLYFYPEKEAIDLTSRVRYTNTYTLGLVIVAVGYAILNGNDIFRSNNRKIWRWGVILLIVVLIFQTPQINILYKYQKTNIDLTNNIKAGILPWINLINTNLKERETVFIYAKFNDIESPILAYEIFSRKFSSGKFKKVERTGMKPYWISALSPDELTVQLETGKFQYLLVDRVDTDFWGKYCNLFGNLEEAKQYRLFKVDADGEKFTVTPLAK